MLNFDHQWVTDFSWLLFGAERVMQSEFWALKIASCLGLKKGETETETVKMQVVKPNQWATRQ